MKITTKGIDIIKKYEGCKLKAYLCPANKVTIGWGNTAYKDGSVIKINDKITQEQADDLLMHTLNYFANGIKKLLKKDLNDNQFNALLSFAYNAGLENLRISTLLRKINVNPADPTIRDEFAKWNIGGGKVLPGLVKRRKQEADLYFL